MFQRARDGYPNEQEIADLASRWDKGDKVSWSGRFFSLALSPLGYPKLEGGQAIPAYRGPSGFSDSCGVADEEWKKEFDQHDRAATRAGNRHRDRVVLLHLLAAMAVLTAVLGVISLWGMSLPWAVAEFLILCAIIRLVRQDRRQGASAHSAWLVLRQAAESFRMQALLRPFAGEANLPIAAARAPLLALLEYQVEYHRKAHARWDQLNRGLERGTRWIFYVVAGAVALHLIPVAVESWKFIGHSVPPWMQALAHLLHSPKWLILTAAGPAFAACLHGIGGKLEVKRLAGQSESMTQQLTKFQTELAALNDEGSTAPLAAVAKRIAAAMNAEHATWLYLLQDCQLDE